MRRLLPTLFFLVCVALACAAYYPGLSGAFLFDDAINITNNESLRITALSYDQLKNAALSGGAGILGRSVSTLTFALDYYHSGLDAPAFKLTNLVIHVLTGIAVFYFVSLLLAAHAQRPGATPVPRAPWIAAALAATWLLHPLNLTTVLYVVQRMTSLAALFCLLGMISYLAGRLLLLRGSTRQGWAAILSSLVLWTPLAMLSKENGALLPLFLLMIEAYFFRLRTPGRRSMIALVALFAVAVVLPAIGALLYTMLRPEWILKAYKMRNFTLVERLLTESRVLWLYIRMAFMPDVTILGLYHDDLQISRSLTDPVSTLPALAGVAALVAAAVAGFRRHPMLSFGIAFFLAGHVMESTVFGLELAHEHRNYLPLIGLLLPLYFYLLGPSAQMKSALARPAIVACILALMGGVTLIRATQWGDPALMLEKEAEHHPKSVRANIALANQNMEMRASSSFEAELLYQAAYAHYAAAAELSPTDTLGLFGLMRMNLERGLPLEESWLPVLSKRISGNPIAPDTINTLVLTEQCVSDKRCKFTSGIIDTLLQAALSNTSLEPPRRAVLMLAWSNHLQARGDTEQAVAAGREAIRLDPANLDNQEAVIVFLINMKRDREAQAQIDATRRMDKLQVKKAILDGFERILSARQPLATSH